MSIDKMASSEEPEGFEIEIVDDTPEQDRGKKRRPEGVEPEIPEDDEIATYSENVQKRLKKLKYEYHEERRRKEEALREHEAAVTFARNVLEERNALAERLAKGEEALIEQAKRRAQAQLEQAEREYREAHEVGDADGIITAQKNMMRLTTEQQQLESYRHQPPPKLDAERIQPRPAPNEPDERAKNWLKSNPWFGQDEEMSGYAYGVHEKLIKKEGINPLSDEYYNRIDAAMRRRFPENFEDEGGQEIVFQPQSSPRRIPVVAPAARVSANAPRKVQLTASQVSLAKRLGLKPEEYAASLVKEMMNG